MYPALTITEQSFSPTRVFIAHDHALIRDCVRLIVENQPDMSVVGEAKSGIDAPEAICNSEADVVLIGISVPDEEGIERAIHILEHCPHMKGLILSLHQDYSCVIKLLEAGACGYVLQQSSGEELVRAIRTVVVGQPFLDIVLTNHLLGVLAWRKSTFKGAPQNAPLLSGREEEVLHLYTQGYVNKEIAVRLRISEKTVATYKLRSLRKLNLDGRVAAIKYAVRQGWLQPGGVH